MSPTRTDKGSRKVQATKSPRSIARGERRAAREGGGSAREGGESTRGEYVSAVHEALSAVEVTPKVIERGVKLFERGMVRRNKTYPWIFMVSGDRHRAGSALYRVDLSRPLCSCSHYEYSGKVCKHIVAAAAQFRKDEA